MTDEPLVSILIPAYNAENWLGQAIDSCLNQSWSAIEIIVVNDGSQDSTWNVAQQYSTEQRIILINQPNKGASAARNAAFQASKGKYIQYLDADDVLDSQKIAIQMGYVLSMGDDYVYSSEWSFFFEGKKDFVRSDNPLYKDYNSPVDWLVTAWTKKSWMQPTAWLTPRHLIEAAGKWDETLSLHDDGEFFCRVLLQSKGIKFCKGALSYYRKGIVSSLSGQVSERAVVSHLAVCNSYTRNILKAENSVRTRVACAANYQEFVYNYFPFYSKYTVIAENEIKKLGGSDSKITGGPVFIFFSKLVGWKLAKLIQMSFRKLK